MKHLPKHLRPRWRYLAVDIESWPDATITESLIQSAVWDAARNLLGDTGCAAIDMRVTRCEISDGTGRLLLRVRRGEVARARAAVACVETISGHPIGIGVVGVSGTIRAAEEKYMNAPPGPADEERVVFEGTAFQAIARGDGRYDLREEGGFTGATELDFE